MPSPWDHPAHPGCYYVVRETGAGQICVICYHHVLMFSMVRVKRDDVPVCQTCGNALAERGALRPSIVQAMSACMLRRLILDSELAKYKQILDATEIDEDTVVH